MSVNIGSNFLYQGKKFLDDRINIARLEDLKDFKIPIPDGFEVCVDGNWYTYKSTNTIDPVLGRFRLREVISISQEFGDSDETTISQATLTKKIEELEGYINSLIENLLVLEFTYITDGSIVEVGSRIIPEISWEIGYKNINKAQQPIYAEVNGSTDGVAEDYKSWKSQEELCFNTPTSINYNIEVWSGIPKVSKNIVYNFFYKKYCGASTSQSLNPYINSSDLQDFNYFWVENNSISMRSEINCWTEDNSGIYPYFLIPTVLLNENNDVIRESIKVSITDNSLNTESIDNYKISDVIITTVDNFSIPYKAIQLPKQDHSNTIIIEIR